VDGYAMTTPQAERSYDPKREEFVNRTMDRLMATAKYGPQPKRPTRQTEITRQTPNGPVSIAFTLADTEAVLAEMDLDAPCGICHHNPCTYSTTEPDD